MAWLNGWSYRKTVTITGETGAGTGYQVNLSVGDGSGGDFNLESHCTSFPNDIQVTDNDQTTPLDYWVEDLTVDPISMWVEVADDLGTNVDICVYYGKSGESSASNGANTFVFFDDFEDGTMDWSTRDADDGTWVETGGVLKQTADLTVTWGGYVGKSIPSLPTNFVLNCKIRQDTAAIEHTLVGVTGNFAIYGSRHVDESIQVGGLGFANTKALITRWDNGAVTHIAADFVATADTWYEYMLKKDGNTAYGYWNDGTWHTIGSIDVSGIATPLDNVFAGIHYTQDYASFDDFRVRKYVSPEPAFLSAGGEESAPTVAVPVFMHHYQNMRET